MRIGSKRTPGLVVQPNSLEVPAGAVEKLENVVHVQDNVYIKERGFKNFYPFASGVNYYGIYEFDDYIHLIANDTVTVLNKNGAITSGPTASSTPFEIDGTLRPSGISFTYAPFTARISDFIFFCTPDGTRVARSPNSAVTSRPGLEAPLIVSNTPYNQYQYRRCSWTQIAGSTIEVTLATVAPDIRLAFFPTDLWTFDALSNGGATEEPNLNGKFTISSQNYAGTTTTLRFTASGSPTNIGGTLYIAVGFVSAAFADTRQFGVNDMNLVPVNGYYTPISGATTFVPGDCPADKAISYKAVLRRTTTSGILESAPSSPVYGFNGLRSMGYTSTGTTTVTINYTEHNLSTHVSVPGKILNIISGTNRYTQGEGTRTLTATTKDALTFVADQNVPAGTGTLLMQVNRFSIFEIVLPRDAVTGDVIDLYFSESEIDLSDNPTAVPNGDYYLAKSITLTAGDIAAKKITPDLTGGVFQKGIPLYTNPSDGDRTRQPNNLPPGANSLAVWKGCLFFGGCYQRNQVSLIHIGTELTADGTITVTSALGTENFTFRRYQNTADGAVIKTRMQFLCAEINRNSSNYVAYYLNDTTETPGSITIQARVPNLSFSIYASSSTIGNTFEPSIGNVSSQLASTREEVVNRIYWSKQNQPEAVPFFIDVGSDDKYILNIQRLRDSLVVVKEDGIFTLYGDPGSGVLQIRELDSTIHGISATGVTTLGNKVYAKSDQGIIAITESSVVPVSRNQIEPLVKLSDENFTQDTIMYGQEEDRMLYVCTAKSPVDPTKIVYGYNFLTQTWSELKEVFTWAITLDVNSAVTSGVLNNNRILIDETLQMVRLERKDNLLTDWADNDVAETVTALASDNKDVTFGGDIYAVGSVVRWTNAGVDKLYRIVSVSGTTHTLDIPFGGAVSASVRVFTPIRSVIRTAPIDGGDSSIVKQFTKLILNMRYDALSACTLEFRSDWFEYGEPIPWEKTTERRGWGAEQWGRFPWGQATADALQYVTKPSQIVQTEIPRPLQKSTYIQAEITHEVACEGMFIQQMSFETRPSSDKAAR